MTLKKKQKKLNIQTMGVINITPDSFSDGGAYLDESILLSSFNQFDILDIGAESTAPFNSAISSKDELTRFENHLIPLLKNIADPQKTISIDSYKPEVFYEIALLLKRIWPKTKLIFNDISGKVDDELFYLFKDSLEFDYVLCHNLCSNRSESSNHMNYLSNEVIHSVESFFSKNQSLLKYGRKVYADPCFGFSKTYEQNHLLLRNLHLLESLKRYDSTVIGISRKSFLRVPRELDLKSNLSHIEQVHASLLAHLFKTMQTDLIIRSHDINPIKSALISNEILQ